MYQSQKQQFLDYQFEQNPNNNWITAKGMNKPVNLKLALMLFIDHALAIINYFIIFNLIIRVQ